MCLVVLELATRKTGSFIFYRFFPQLGTKRFLICERCLEPFQYIFSLGVWTIFFGLCFSCFWNHPKIVSSFCSYNNFGWCAVLVLEPSLYVETWFLSIFWGDAFALKKYFVFLELWFLKLRFCKFRSLWTNIDPFLLSIIVETPLFRVWETFKKYLWVVLFPVWKPSKKYCFFLDFFWVIWRSTFPGFRAFREIQFLFWGEL